MKVSSLGYSDGWFSMTAEWEQVGRGLSSSVATGLAKAREGFRADVKTSSPSPSPLAEEGIVCVWGVTQDGAHSSLVLGYCRVIPTGFHGKDGRARDRKSKI